MRRISVVMFVVAALVGVFGVFTPAKAGTGSADGCNNGTWGMDEFPLVTSPITLGLEVNRDINPLTPTDGHYGEPHVRLCYSTSPAGYAGQDTTGGSIELKLTRGRYAGWPTETGLRCTPQSNPTAVPISCYAGVEQGTWPTSDTTVCVNTCVTNTWPLGPTDVYYNPDELEYDLLHPERSRPAGTWYGAGVTIPDVRYCVDGSCSSPTANAGDVGVGVNQPFGTDLFYYLSPACGIEIPGCTALPAATVTNNGAPVAVVQGGTTVVPVTPPVGNCVVTTAVPSTCPLP